jgi:hypothetical protein
MKKKILLSVLLSVLLVILAGCASETGQKTGAAAPDGQINVPAVNLQVNSPAMSIEVVLPGPNPLINTAGAQNRVAGVLTGIWHGIISPVTLVTSFVNPAMQMVEVHNDGSPYNLGFLLGTAIVFLLIGGFVGSRRH